MPGTSPGMTIGRARPCPLKGLRRCPQSIGMPPAKSVGGAMSLADKFNLLNEMNILRIICGAFFIPHIYAKFMVPEALGFFVAAKFNPPKTWMYLACVIEIVLALALIFGVWTFWAAAATAIYMVIICAAIYKVTGN